MSSWRPSPRRKWSAASVERGLPHVPHLHKTLFFRKATTMNCARLYCALSSLFYFLAAADGDAAAARDLLPLVYSELRSLAQARMAREAPGHTLQPTALVHEAYLGIIRDDDADWDCRGHFFAVAAGAMRQILVESARRKMAQKRGGGKLRLSTEQVAPTFEPPSEDILAVDEVVKRLEREDPRKGQIVNLRFFARMTTAETAAALGISIGTVRREWQYIRTWLQAHLTDGGRT